MRKFYRIIFLVVGMVGLIDSLYLTYVKLSHTEALCIPGVGDCATVNTSSYSQIYGIPVALLGALSYLALLLLTLISGRNQTWETNIQYATFGISLIGFLYSLYLTYLEIAVIRAICPFCIISAIAMLVLFALSLDRLVMNQEVTKH